MPDTWSPSVYLQFGDERTRPARDLLAHVPLATPRRVVDVGCGPGNSTALLLSRYPDATVSAFDSSPAMIDEARRTVPAARYFEADAASWLPEPDTDLVFANATYQWIPDHLDLFGRMLKTMRAGAVLAVQMPDNVAEPTHRLMETVAADPRWADRLAGAARAPLPSPRSYYEMLEPVASRVDIWHTVYNHVLDGPDDIVQWVQGTGLRPFVYPLAADEQTVFLSRYRQLVAEAYPPLGDGRVVLRFPRLFILASR